MSSYAYTSTHKAGPQNAPQILAGPQDKYVQVESKVRFSVTATGADPLRYQWYKDGAKLAGAESSEYQIDSAADAQEGVYHCVVTNNYGSAETDDAILDVAAKPPDWNPDNPYPGPQPPGWGEDPEDEDNLDSDETANFKLAITDVPETAYIWVDFDITIEATDVDGEGRTFDGDGGKLVGFLKDSDGNIITGAGTDTVDLSSGWSSNSLTHSDSFVGVDAIRNDADAIKIVPWIEKDGKSYVGDSASVNLETPAFVPLLPSEVEPSIEFNYDIECRDTVAGSVLSDYMRNGLHLYRTWMGYNDTDGYWEELPDDDITDSSLTDEANWSSGVYSGTAKLANIAGYSKVRLVVTIRYAELSYSGDATVDEEQALKYAIDERETAVGVTGLDPANSYTLDELKTYVNNIAPNYIADNSYDGGSAKPTMLSSNYADSAEDKSELYALVKDMIYTVDEEGESGIIEKVSEGTGTNTGDDEYDFQDGTNGTTGTELSTPESWGQQANEAENDYTLNTDPSWDGDDVYYFTHFAYFFDQWYEYSDESNDYGRQNTVNQTYQWKYGTTLADDGGLSRRAFFYLKAEKNDIAWYDPPEEDKDYFDPQGLNVLENNYTYALRTDWQTSASISFVFGRQTACPNWPPTSVLDTVDHEENWEEFTMAGFRVYQANMFILTKWGFKYQ